MDDKLKQTLERILALEDNFNLHMGEFKAIHKCGTSYCIAGILALHDNYPRRFFNHKGNFNYIEYSENLVGYSGDIWYFLFSENWPNWLKHAKKRAQYVLDNGTVPKDFNYKWGIKEGDDDV